MNKITTVDLTLSTLITDLSNGLTWLKKDDMGNGSIQEKYNANDLQIKTIQKHPKLVGIEPSLTVFRIIDDMKDEEVQTAEIKKDDKTSIYTKESKSAGTNRNSSSIGSTTDKLPVAPRTESVLDNSGKLDSAPTTEEDFDKFLSL